MPLRILNVTQVYPPATEASGQAQKVQAISRHLVRHGHRVTVLTARRGRTAGAPDTGVEMACLPSPLRYRTLTLNPGIAGFCLRRLRGFDIVHLYGIYDLLGPVVASFCRQWDIPYVLEPLGMFRPIIRNIAIKHLYRRLLGWPVVQGATRVIVTSELERDELIAEGVPSNQLVVRRNGVDLPNGEAPTRGSFRREIGIADDTPLVLYLGRLSRKKGLDLLVEAFSGLPAHAVLAIVGPDDGDGCLRDLERLRVTLGLDGRMRLLPPRFGTDKYAALVDADIFVLPSRNENFGNAVAEAVACGVPVVVTERCGIAPLVRDRAGLVVACEARALRSALGLMIEDRDFRNRLRAGAVESRQALSWDEPVAQMEALYMECTQTSRSRIRR